MIEAFLCGLLPWGLHQTDLGLLVLRLGAGIPFAISGFNKCFCPVCHGWLRANLGRSGIPCVGFTVWWLAGWEMIAGVSLAIGVLSSASAFVLFIVCVIAFLVSWRRKLEAKRPAHFLDACTEIGFMFDVLLIWMVLAVMCLGPGGLSLDHILFRALMP